MAGRGKILRWLPTRRYGFLVDDDVDGDVFIHEKDVLKANPADRVELKAGQRVMYDLDPGSDKPKAVNLKAEDGTLIKPSRGGHHHPYKKPKGKDRVTKETPTKDPVDIIMVAKVMAESLVSSLMTQMSSQRQACSPSLALPGQGSYPMPFSTGQHYNALSSITAPVPPAPVLHAQADRDPFVPLPSGGHLRLTQLLSLDQASQQQLMRPGSALVSAPGHILSSDTERHINAHAMDLSDNLSTFSDVSPLVEAIDTFSDSISFFNSDSFSFSNLNYFSITMEISSFGYQEPPGTPAPPLGIL